MRKFIPINSRPERAHSSQCSAVQCSTIKNYKYVKQQMILFPITRNSSRVRQPLWVSRENVTALLRWLQDLFQIKIENICLFKLIKKNMETSLKTGFAQIFSCCPKNLSCPKLGGAAAPLAPLARTPMPLSSFDTHARWQPVTQSARSRWSYGKIEDCKQSRYPAWAGIEFWWGCFGLNCA